MPVPVINGTSGTFWTGSGGGGSIASFFYSHFVAWDPILPFFITNIFNGAIVSGNWWPQITVKVDHSLSMSSTAWSFLSLWPLAGYVPSSWINNLLLQLWLYLH